MKLVQVMYSRVSATVRLLRVLQVSRGLVVRTPVTSATRACNASPTVHRSLSLPTSSPYRSTLSLPERLPPLTSTCPTSRQPVAALCTKSAPGVKKDVKTVSITFTDRDGDVVTVQGKLGDTLLDVAHEHDIDLEGACEGTLSCSTCHLIVDPEWYDRIPDPLTEEEQDMLDLAYGLTDTSRLGCQIVVTKDLDGIKFTVPSGTSDARNL